MQPEQHTIVRLINPYANTESPIRVQTDISTEDYNYLFRGVLAGCRGTQSQIVGTLIQKLIHELKSRNIPAHYDPDHECRVASLVSGCTFGRVAGDAVARVATGGSEKVSRTGEDVKIKSTNLKGKAGAGKRRDRKEGEEGEKVGVGNG